MDRDTEILKIKILADYYHSKYNNSATYIFSITIAFSIALMTLLFQKKFELENYFIGIGIITAFLFILLFIAHRNYMKNLDRIDELLQQVNKGEVLPPLRELRPRRQLL